MEIHIRPAGFNFVRSPNGDAVQVIALDPAGTTVHLTMGAAGFAEFQAFVADPDAYTAGAAARGKLVLPGGVPGAGQRLKPL